MLRRWQLGRYLVGAWSVVRLMREGIELRKLAQGIADDLEHETDKARAIAGSICPLQGIIDM